MRVSPSNYFDLFSSRRFGEPELRRLNVAPLGFWESFYERFGKEGSSTVYVHLDGRAASVVGKGHDQIGRAAKECCFDCHIYY